MGSSRWHLGKKLAWPPTAKTLQSWRERRDQEAQEALDREIAELTQEENR